MGFDLEGKVEETIQAQEPEVKAPVNDSSAAIGVDASAALFIELYRSIVDANNRAGLNLSTDQFAMLQTVYGNLGNMEKYAVQAALSGTYENFGAFAAGDYMTFVA